MDPVAVDGGSAVMYTPGKILKTGNTADVDLTPVPSTANSYVLDMNQPTPRWRQTPPMAFRRTTHNLTVLPDGNVLCTGGAINSDVFDLAAAVYNAAELWSPVTETWTTLAKMRTPRMYHSVVLLLPDGRVLAAGGGRYGVDQFSAEIYSPPYLFKGLRPTITSAPSTVNYGSTFFVSTADASRIASVSLIGTAAVTHAFDENQRFVKLTFQQAPGGLNVQAPASANLAPPGYYMLFLVDTNGVPSVAAFVRFPSPAEDAQPPTAPANLVTSAGIGFASLGWTASTDNIGVTGYNIHRATTPGVTPTSANRIAQTTTTTHTDFVPAGVYYVVAAYDAAGNISPPSNEATATVLADSTSPSVSMTAPASGATVSGSVTVSASASDNVAVAGLQFLLDGANLGTEDTSAPYSSELDYEHSPQRIAYARRKGPRRRREHHHLTLNHCAGFEHAALRPGCRLLFQRRLGHDRHGCFRKRSYREPSRTYLDQCREVWQCSFLRRS